VVYERNDWGYQVSEVPFNHELQGFGCARGVPSDHGAPGHYLANMGGVGIQALCGDLKRVSELERQKGRYQLPYRPDPWP